MTNTQRVAVVGLGLIGYEWAKHLHTDGVLSASWNRTPRREAPCLVANLDEIPARAELIHVVVADEKAVSAVIDVLLRSLTDAHTIVQSSTIDPVSSTTLKRKVEGRGARYVEAPFTGSLPAAKERKTVFFLGGEPSAVEHVRQYLARLSQNQITIGTNEQACATKLAMNLQIVSAMAAMAEAITICRNAGVTDDVFFSVFKLNAAYSGVAALKEPKIRGRDFSPQFSVKHTAKDMRLLSETLNHESKFSILSTVLKKLQEAESAGLGEDDFSAIIKLIQ